MNTPVRPWLDSALPVDERVRLLRDAMTIEEKVAQMVQVSYSLVSESEADDWARLGAGSFLHTLGDNARRIQRLATESRLGIPTLFGIDAIHGHGIHNGATIFPSQLALAASWNRARGRRRGASLDVLTGVLPRPGPPVGKDRRDLRRGSLPRRQDGRGDGARVPGRKPRQS